MKTRLAELLDLRQQVDREIRQQVRIEAAAALRAGPVRYTKRSDPACGTETGYQRHRHREEHRDLKAAGDPCGCLEAHRDYNRHRDQLRDWAAENDRTIPLHLSRRMLGA